MIIAAVVVIIIGTILLIAGGVEHVKHNNGSNDYLWLSIIGGLLLAIGVVMFIVYLVLKNKSVKNAEVNIMKDTASSKYDPKDMAALYMALQKK